MPTKNEYNSIKNAVKQAIRESETLEEAEKKVDVLFDRGKQA